MRNLSLIILALMTALSSNAIAVNPVDMIASPLQSNVNLSQQELEKKAVEHIAQGNLTREHISQDLNATAEQLKKQAVEHINQTLNITPEQLQQRAKEEIKNQVNQRVQQPGFEAIIAVAGILGIAFALRRNTQEFNKIQLKQLYMTNSEVATLFKELAQEMEAGGKVEASANAQSQAKSYAAYLARGTIQSK